MRTTFIKQLPPVFFEEAEEKRTLLLFDFFIDFDFELGEEVLPLLTFYLFVTPWNKTVGLHHVYAEGRLSLLFGLKNEDTREATEHEIHHKR